MKWLLLVAVVVPVQAVTPEQIQACAPDASRVCASSFPDPAAIKKCMIKNKSQLSEECKKAFGK